MSTKLATLRESLLLEEAERRAVGYSAEQAAAIERLSAAAASRAALARKARPPGEDATAAALLREALVFRLRAQQTALGQPDAPVSAAMLPSLAAEDQVRIDRVLSTSDVSELETLSPEELESLIGALGRAERAAARSFESRSVVVIRTVRASHYAGLVLAGLLIVFHGVRAIVTPPNVALHRPVSASAFAADSAPPETLVDGEGESRTAVVTGYASGAWLAVDLGASYTIQSVTLVNRQDRGFDSALPFWIEVSSDGEHFRPLVKRRDHFRTWTYDVPASQGAWVRIVRLRCAGCSIGLNELEVRGRPAS